MKSQANSLASAKKVRIFEMSKNSVSSCLLFALLSDLFLLSRKIALVENQILGKMDPKNIPSVPQHAAAGPPFLALPGPLLPPPAAATREAAVAFTAACSAVRVGGRKIPQCAPRTGSCMRCQKYNFRYRSKIPSASPSCDTSFSAFSVHSPPRRPRQGEEVRAVVGLQPLRV